MQIKHTSSHIMKKGKWNTTDVFVGAFMLHVSEYVTKSLPMFHQTDTYKQGFTPSCLPPSLPACELLCDVITHRKFLIKLATEREREREIEREGKKTQSERDKQWQLRWEFEMAHERTGVKEDILLRKLLCFLSSASWLMTSDNTTRPLTHFYSKEITPSAHLPFSNTWTTKEFPFVLPTQ